MTNSIQNKFAYEQLHYICSLICVCLLQTTAVFAKNDNNQKINVSDEKKSFTILFTKENLSKKQLDIIESGTPAYSEIVAQLANSKFIKSCSLKYDIWNEDFSYNLTSTERNETHTHKDFDTLKKSCLSITISKAEISKLAKKSKLLITLKIEQFSPEESEKIRRMLIQQQSIAPNAFFERMLGPLRPSEMTQFELIPPP